MATSPLITSAKDFARSKHASIIWKTVVGDRLQFEHLQEVAETVKKVGGSEVEVAAAWLHDSVEDTNTTLEVIRELFGDEVAAIVDELTDPEDIRHLPTVERKARQTERIKSKSVSAKKIKLADQISNVRFVTNFPKVHWTVENQKAYVLGARQIANVCKSISPVLDELFDAEYQNAVEKLGIYEP